jgi:hypothetical protein
MHEERHESTHLNLNGVVCVLCPAVNENQYSRCLWGDCGIRNCRHSWRWKAEITDSGKSAARADFFLYVIYMNILTAKGCTVAKHGCNPPHHPGYAWAFAILLVSGISVYTIFVTWRTQIARRALAKGQANGESIVTGEPNDDSQEGQKKTVSDRPTIYDLLQPHAKNVKAVLQMAIGIITVTAVGARYLDTVGNGDPTSLFLNGIGIGLAAAAALELAYTLFTDGPDEALDPLMLGLASTLLLKLAGLTGTPSLSQVGALALLGLLLIGLFAARLMLAESTHEQPKIWWIPRLSRPDVDRDQSSPSPNATAPQPQTPAGEGSNA